MAAAFVSITRSLTAPTHQLQESTWAIVDLADVTMTVMTVAGTTVILAGTVTVTVTVLVTEARNEITTVAIGTGVTAVALLRRAAGIRLTIGVAKVYQGPLRLNGALSALLTDEITKLLVPTHLPRRLAAGKGSE